MADIVSSEVRSRMMSGIRHKNTKPELTVRSLLHRMGLRYKLHVKNLPGKPDLVFPKYSAVIFIHGCFWHGHDCSLFKKPSSNRKFWSDKIGGNKLRDDRSIRQLENQGWRVLVIWECSMRGIDRVPLEQLANKCYKWVRSKKEKTEITSV